MSSENFAEMFEKSIESSNKRLEVGEQLTTEIVEITKDYVFVFVSGKSEGVIDLEEFTDEKGSHDLTIGDQITVHYLGYKNGEMRFTTKIASEKASAAVIENAYKNRIPIEGTYEKEIKGGYEVKVGNYRAFCPYSQTGVARKKTDDENDDSSLIGTKQTFLIIEYKDGGRSITVSHRAILEEQKQAAIETLKESIKLGSIVNGKVVSLQKFGAFIDIGGVQALLPISEMSRLRVENASDIVSVGETIEAKIINLDWDNNRISVSIKHQEENPWESLKKRRPVGTKLTGKIVRIAGFGIFVNIEPGIDGLVHESLLKGDSQYGDKNKNLKVGEKILVEIQSIDTKAERVSLKLAKSSEDEALMDKYIETDNSDSGDTYNPFANLLKK